MKIRKGDTVRILAGKDRGKTGIIERVLPKDSQAVVSGVNLMKKHRRARAQGTSAGIMTLPAPLPASRLMVVCPHCQKATRIKIVTDAAGNRQRACRHCNEVWLPKE